MSNVRVAGSLMPSTSNTPLDSRSVVSSESSIKSIQNPYVGLIVYDSSDKKFYFIKSLEETNVNGIPLGTGVGDYESFIKEVIKDNDKRDDDPDKLYIDNTNKKIYRYVDNKYIEISGPEVVDNSERDDDPNKLYIDNTNKKIYRYINSSYVEIGGKNSVIDYSKKDGDPDKLYVDSSNLILYRYSNGSYTMVSTADYKKLINLPKNLVTGVGSTDSYKIQPISQTTYDNLTTKNSNTIYLITS